MRLKYYTICFDGIDRSGKDTIARYIDRLSGGKYLIKVRGIMSMNAYAKKFNRQNDYDIEQQRSIINVLLTVNREDWIIRCKLTKEQKIDYAADSKLFLDEYESLKAQGLPCLMFNTSTESIYSIVKKVLKYADSLNKE